MYLAVAFAAGVFTTSAEPSIFNEQWRNFPWWPEETNNSIHSAPSPTRILLTSTPRTIIPVTSRSSSASFSDDGVLTSVPATYAQKVLLSHNVHRANHSASALVWSDHLALSARKIAISCVYAHNTAVDGGGYGQNIAAGISADNVTAVVTDLFYNSEVEWFLGLYQQQQPSMANFEHWGHFSQVVWKSTTKM